MEAIVIKLMSQVLETGRDICLRQTDNPSQHYLQMALGWTEIHNWVERYILVSWMRWCNVIPRIIRVCLEQPWICARCYFICQPKSCLSHCVFFISLKTNVCEHIKTHKPVLNVCICSSLFSGLKWVGLVMSCTSVQQSQFCNIWSKVSCGKSWIFF